MFATLYHVCILNLYLCKMLCCLLSCIATECCKVNTCCCCQCQCQRSQSSLMRCSHWERWWWYVWNAYSTWIFHSWQRLLDQCTDDEVAICLYKVVTPFFDVVKLGVEVNVACSVLLTKLKNQHKSTFDKNVCY